MARDEKRPPDSVREADASGSIGANPPGEWIRDNPATLDGPLTASVAWQRNLLLTHARGNHKGIPDLYSRQNGHWHMYKFA